MLRLTVAAMLLAGQAMADVTGSEMLYHNRFWSVELVSFDDGTDSCALSSFRGAVQSIIIWAGPHGVDLQVHSDNWSMADRYVTINVDVDRAGFTGTARATEGSLIVFDLAGDFLSAVALGRTLTVRNDLGERLMVYSLAGSAAAMGKLVECYAAVLTPTDPYQGRGDPT
jgi:hypothetical protein